MPDLPTLVDPGVKDLEVFAADNPLSDKPWQYKPLVCQYKLCQYKLSPAP